MPNYGDPRYWEKRYTEQDGATFDWLEKYDSIKKLIKDLIPKENSILIIGCGNAELGENMYDDGFTNLTNIDIASVVISQMAKRNTSRPNMVFKCMDVCQMEFADASFNAVIDKSTMDSILCGDKSDIVVAHMMKVD